jgi:hypothetical protein
MLLMPIRLVRYEMREIMVAALYVHGDYAAGGLLAEEFDEQKTGERLERQH